MYRFEISVRSITATPWIPSDHLISKQTLTDTLLLSKIRKCLPQKANLVHLDNFSSFVTVKEIDFENNDEDKQSENKKRKEEIVGESINILKNRNQKKERRENDIKNIKMKKDKKVSNSPVPPGGVICVDWSDGSCATVGKLCGRLLR